MLRLYTAGRIYLAVIALMLTGSFSSQSLHAQTEDGEFNLGGTKFLSIRPGQTLERTLQTNIPSPLLVDPFEQIEFPEPAIDSWKIEGLTPNVQYRIRITTKYESESQTSGFTVFNRVAGQDTGAAPVRSYEHDFTATSTSYNSIEVFFAVGTRTFLTGLASSTYLITVRPLSDFAPVIYGANFELTDGTPFKSPNDPTIWMMENDTKRAFTSIYHFDSWFYGRTDMIVLVGDYLISTYPTGPNMPFRDGSLLAYADRPSDKTVFIIHRGVRKAFPTWSSFIAFGYSAQNIKAIPGRILDSVQRGVDFTPQLRTSSIDATPVLLANTSVIVNPATPSANQSVAIATKITPTVGTATDAIFDVEIYNAAGQKVFQQVFEHEYFLSGQPLTFTTNWTPTATGQYTIKVGIFSSNWATNYFWNNGVGVINVGDAPQPNPTPTPSSALTFTSSVTVQPNPAIVNQAANLTLSVTNGSTTTASGINVDLEVYNSAGQRVFQKVYDNVNLSPSQPVSLPQVAWTPTATGQYTIKVGIFSSNWAITYYWLDNALTVNVGSSPTSALPTAAFSMVGGGLSGGNNQTLRYIVPRGGSVSISFNGSASSAGTGTITAYGWYINDTFLSQSPSFNYTLGHGVHQVVLTVTNSAGGTNSVPATIMVTEAPEITSIAPTIPVSSGQDQNITVNGSGFQQGLTVDIVFPNGGGTNLSGAQIVSVSQTSFVLRVTLGAAGNWSIKVNNPDGSRSGVFSFSVR